MQVNTIIEHNIGESRIMFEATGGTEDQAIAFMKKVAAVLAKGNPPAIAESDMPAASTDKEVIEKHTGAEAAFDKADAALKEAGATVGEASGKKVKADAKKNSPAPDASPANTASGETKTAGAGEKTAAEHAAEARNAPEYDYTKDVRPLILDMSKNKGREPTVAALARFGAKAGADLKPEQYAEAVAYFTDVITGKVDPLAADSEEALA